MQENRLTGGSMASPALVREDGGPAFALRRIVNTIFAGVMFSRHSLIFKPPTPHPHPPFLNLRVLKHDYDIEYIIAYKEVRK